MPGRTTKALTKAQIERLRKFKNSPHDGAAAGYSLPQLRMAMAAPFGWQTLKKALLGLPVWDLHHSYIVCWMDRCLQPVAVDRKTAAAGEGHTDGQ